MAEVRSPRGITFVEGMQIMLIGLKLAGFIDWSWYVVLSPLIVEGVLALVLLLLIYLIDD